MIVRPIKLALDIVRLHAVVGRVNDRAVLDADHGMGHLPLGGEADGLAHLARGRGEDDVTWDEQFDLDASQRTSPLHNGRSFCTACGDGVC